jgi:hypothetical protein
MDIHVTLVEFAYTKQHVRATRVVNVRLQLFSHDFNRTILICAVLL